MFRCLAALTLVTTVVASTISDVVDARVLHSIVDDPLDDEAGRRLILIGLLGGRGDLIALCKKMHYKSLCTALATLPGVTTPQLLLEAALRVTAANAALAEMRLDEAIDSPIPRDTAMMSSLQSCRESYASLVDSIESARATLKGAGTNADLMTQLSAAGTYSTDCEDIFAERPELKSPIPGEQRHVSRLVSNCLNLAAIIEEKN